MKERNTTSSRPLALFALIAAALAAAVTPAASVSHAAMEAPPLTGGSPPYEPPPGLEAPSVVRIDEREATRIVLQWWDNTDVEDGYEILRSVDGGPYSSVVSYGPLADALWEYADENLQPEALYCYSVRVVQGSTWKSSAPQCAYTAALERRPIFRAQLEITTANKNDAGTDDPVSVRLNSPINAPYLPQGNFTALDHSGNDFTKGSTYAYDLTPVDDVEDLTMLSIEKEGTDGLCISKLRLILNETGRAPAPGVVVFERNFGNCHWIDGNDGHEPVLSYFFHELRSEPSWPQVGDSWCNPDPAICQATTMAPIPVPVLEQRLESALGTVFRGMGSNKVRWRNDGGPGSGITLTPIDYRTMHLHLELEAVIDNAFDPSVTLDADVRIGAHQIEDGNAIDLSLENVSTQIDFSLTDALVCMQGGWLFGAPALAGTCLPFLEVLEYFGSRFVEDKLDGAGGSFPLGSGGQCAILYVNISPDELTGIPVPCDDFDQDGMDNEWEQEHGLDPNYHDAGENPDGDSRTNLQEYQADQDPFCAWDYDHPNYCRDCGPCKAGMSDCDNDAECEGNLVCKFNVGADYGLPADWDVCDCPLEVNDAQYCAVCGPCPAGTGDCDSDDECVAGTACSHNVGVFYGLGANWDVCECALPEGHDDYCEICGPCVSGAGDCDNDEECGGDLFCASNVGQSYGFEERTDVCKCPPFMWCNYVPPYQAP